MLKDTNPKTPKPIKKIAVVKDGKIVVTADAAAFVKSNTARYATLKDCAVAGISLDKKFIKETSS